MAEHLAEGVISQPLTVALNAIVRLASPLGGTLDRIDILFAGGVNNNGVGIFHINIDGAQVGTVSANPGVTSAYVDNLNALIARKSILTIDAAQVPPGGYPAPIYILFQFSDAQGVIKRGQVVYTTPALANNAEDLAGLNLGRGFTLYRLQTSAPARVRLYSRASYRTADAGRAFGVAPARNSGVIFDEETAAGTLIIDLSPFIQGANLEDVVTDEIAAAITNLSGVNQTVTIAITRAAFEGTGLGDAPTFDLEEADGAPSLQAAKVIVANGDLSDLGGGKVRIKTASDVVIPPAGIEVKEQDGAPDLSNTMALVVGNGDLTDLGGGQVRLKTASDVVIPPQGVEVKEADGAPDVAHALTLLVGNGDLTDNGGGSVRIKTASDVFIPAALPPNGAAGGDLGGAYPNPSVAQIRGRSVVGIPLPASSISDNFDDNVLDVSLWGQLDAAHPAIETGGHIEVPASGGVTGLYILTNKNCSGHTTAVQVVSRGGDAYLLWSAFSSGSQYDVLITARNSGVYWPFIFGSSGFVYSGPQSTPVTDGDYIRLRHDPGGNVIYFERSSNAGATWNVEGSFALAGAGFDISNCTIKIRQLGGSGVTIFDNFTSDFADPIAEKDKFALVWDNPSNHFGLQKVLGVVPNVGATPVGAPAGHVAGYSEVVHDKVNHKIWFWNENTGHWDGITLPDAS